MSGFGKVNCGGVLGGWEASNVELDLPAIGGLGVGGSAAAALDGKLSRWISGTWVPASGV